MTIAEAGGGPTVFAHTTAALAANGTEHVSFGFTGTPGVDYVLTLDPGAGNYNHMQRGAIDNLSFNQVAAGTSTFMLIITPNPGTPGNYDFSWDAQAGKVYDLVSSTDLATNPTSWPVYQGQSGLTVNSVSNIPGDGPKRFFAVVARDP